MDKFETLKQTNHNWLEDRPLMKRQNMSDLPTIIGYLRQEAEEAFDNTHNGDTIIQDRVKGIEQELADVGWFLFTAFEVLEQHGGLPMYEAMMEKMARNMLKYPPKLFENIEGDYNAQAGLAKEQWLAEDGNHHFYNGKG